MRIGILTQPLYVNYGGLLQCYALQKKLQMLAHEADRPRVQEPLLQVRSIR